MQVALEVVKCNPPVVTKRRFSARASQPTAFSGQLSGYQGMCGMEESHLLFGHRKGSCEVCYPKWLGSLLGLLSPRTVWVGLPTPWSLRYSLGRVARPDQGEPLRQRVPGCARTGQGVTVPLLPWEEQGDLLKGWLLVARGKCILSSGTTKELSYESVVFPFFFL